MHKNIKKIISFALLSTVVSTNITTSFALDTNEPSYDKYNAELNKEAKYGENIQYIGPFTVDTSLTLGPIPDAPVDTSSLDEYAKAIIKTYIKPNGEPLMLSDIVTVIGFNNLYIESDGELKDKTTNYEWLKFIPNLKSISLDVSTKVCSELDLQKLLTLKKLESLRLNSIEPTTSQHIKNINNISGFPVLNDLSLNNITDLDGIDFSLSKTLSSLDVSKSTFVNKNTILATLLKSTTIKTLTITDVDNQETINNFKNLESLTIKNLTANLDLNVLTNLKKLYIDNKINFGEENCFDANSIKSLNNLETLYITPSKELNIKNIKSLESLTNLTTLQINNTGEVINDLNLNAFTKLESLNLNYTKLNTLSNANKLTKLMVLRVSETDVADVSFLDSAAYKNTLGSLTFGGPKVNLKNLNSIKNASNLEYLNIYNSKIADINDIFSLNKLIDVNLVDVYGFDNININSQTLESLSIDNYDNRSELKKVNVTENNSIVDISINKTNITDVSFVKQLKALKSFDLSNNPITDISPIIEISKSLKDNSSRLKEIFASKEQLEQIKNKLFEGKYSTYKLAKSEYIEEEFWTIKDSTPVNLKESIGLYCEDNKDFEYLDRADYKIEFILDNPRMGYLDENENFVATKSGEISGTLKLANVDSENAKLKLTFTSTISENKGSIKVQYIDTDTKEEIAAPTYMNNLSPGDVTVSAINIDGYDLVGSSSVIEKIDSSNLDKTVVFEYKKQEKVFGKVTIDYVDDKTGEKIKTSKVEDNLELKEYTYEADKIDGYNVVGESTKKVTLTKENSTASIEFRYSKVENTTPPASTGSITVKYLDNSTKKEIATSTVMSNLELKEHTVESKAIEGYTIVGESKVKVTLAESDKNKEVVFNYTKNTTNNNGNNNENNTTTDDSKDDVSTVLSKNDIQSAINNKKGVSVSADNTILELSYDDLVSINKELSEVTLDTKSDKNNLEIRKLMIDNELDILDIFTVESNLKNLKTPILTSFGRSKLNITNGKKAHLYRINTKSRNLELQYIGEATVKDATAYFEVMSNLMDNSNFVITSNKRDSDVAMNNNNNTNNNTNSNNATNTDKENNKEDNKENLPDTSGLVSIIKGLSILSIVTSIVLLRKKKRK